jgi:hypothetical protein
MDLISGNLISTLVSDQILDASVSAGVVSKALHTPLPCAQGDVVVKRHITLHHTTSHTHLQGDVVVLATDGLYDNVFDDEIAAMVAEAMIMRNGRLKAPPGVSARGEGGRGSRRWRASWLGKGGGGAGSTLAAGSTKGALGINV